MELLKIPLLLLMLCVIFIENKSLPSNKTDIIQELMQVYVKRAEQKEKEFEDTKKMLQDLAELSYEASTKPPRGKRLFIKKVCYKFTTIRRKMFRSEAILKRFLNLTFPRRGRGSKSYCQ